MATRKKADIYSEVNSLWPKPLPSMTEGEAIRAACRLYRFAMGRTFVGEVKVSSGNRYTTLDIDQTHYSAGVLIVNPENGWDVFVHVLSHDFYARANPATYDFKGNLIRERPHSKEHARFELKLVKEVLKRNWLDGRLKDKPKQPVTTNDKRLDRLARIDLKIIQLDRRIKRDMNALKKHHKDRKSVLRAIESSEAQPVEKTRKPTVMKKMRLESGLYIDIALFERAKAHGIEIEGLNGLYVVWPPNSLEDDPRSDDHTCGTGDEVAAIVDEYITLLTPNSRQQQPAAEVRA